MGRELWENRSVYATPQGRSVQGLSEIAPLRFLLSPGLFLGLLAAAA